MTTYTKLPVCSEYHPLSELRNQSGYYPNISSEQLKCAGALKTLLVQEGIDVNYNDGEEEFLKLLRFLRARKFNVQNAFKMLKEDHEWRLKENRLTLRSESATTVLQCDDNKISQLYGYFPTWIQGTDKQDRPVSYRQFGKFEIWNVLKLTSLDNLVRFHAWETEQALRLMRNKKISSGYNIETFVLVIDAAGWNMKLATNDAFAFIKGMAVTDSDHYPERLGTMIIINAPSVLSFAWRIIQGFLDAVTKEKINIIGSNPADWQPVLAKYINIDQIPRQYGGTAPDPVGAEAINSMNPPAPSLSSSTLSEDDEDDMVKRLLPNDSTILPDKQQQQQQQQHVLTKINSVGSTTSTCSTQTDDCILDHLVSYDDNSNNSGGVTKTLKKIVSLRW